jgi:hypothetical protein
MERSLSVIDMNVLKGNGGPKGAGVRELVRFKDREPLYDTAPSFRHARSTVETRLANIKNALELKEKFGNSYATNAAIGKAMDDLHRSLGEIALVLLDDPDDPVAMDALEMIHDRSVTLKEKVIVRGLLTLVEAYRTQNALKENGASPPSPEASSSSQ